jgi:hypothetical protein
MDFFLSKPVIYVLERSDSSTRNFLIFSILGDTFACLDPLTQSNPHLIRILILAGMVAGRILTKRLD